jgi:hypothetical protein
VDRGVIASSVLRDLIAVCNAASAAYLRMIKEARGGLPH